MPHRLALPDLRPSPGDLVEVAGREAFHAVSVKRLRVGEAVEVLDGAGLVASGLVEQIRGDRGSHREPALLVRIQAVRHETPVRPAVRVWSAAPKGDRLEQMLDQLAQVGAASWGLLETARGVVEPREHKLERLSRIAAESAKQCGRAHALTLSPPRDIASFRGSGVLVADASGTPATLAQGESPALPEIDLLIGPEGGFTPEELATLKAAGARVARFGPHVMRIETAAVIAAGCLLAHAHPHAHPPAHPPASPTDLTGSHA
jgi:16S rRNA (uracil1498-N3)-methyltransferase